ncbi:MAG: ASPIC/UnbV domain-containing protein, partial [Planctomycetota bacterium]
RQVYGGGSYLSQSQTDLFFGLAETSQVDLTVSWPSGIAQELKGIVANQILTVVEPMAADGNPGE